MKISLISTNTYPGDQGLRTVSSCLKKAGNEVNMIFMVMEEDYSKVYSLKVLRQLGLLCKDSDLIGVSCMASTSIRASQIVNYVKRILEKPVVIGGVHATISPESCVKKADYVVIGEGEEAIVELANKLEKKQKVNKIKNLWTKRFRNPVRKLVENLDKFPFPDFDIEDHYILDKKRIRGFKERDFHGMIFYQTQRGCPHSCTYCINRRLKEIYHKKGKVLRTNSIGYIIKDLVRLKEKFPGVKTIDIRDETFFVRDIKIIRKFCGEYKKKVGLRWKCLASPMNMDEAKLKLMIKAGLTDIIVGIQGCERSNFEVYKRFIKDKDTLKCAKILNKYKKIAVMYDVITCNPYETKEDIINMIRFLQELPKPYYLSVNNLVFFLGSELHSTAKKDSTIKTEKDAAFDLNYWDRWKHIKLKKKNEYLVLILNLMRGVATKRRFGLMPNFMINFLLKEKRVDFHLKHKRLTYFVGSIVAVGDFFREHVLKPTYRSLPTGFKSWYDKVRYRI